MRRRSRSSSPRARCSVTRPTTTRCSTSTGCVTGCSRPPTRRRPAIPTTNRCWRTCAHSCSGTARTVRSGSSTARRCTSGGSLRDRRRDRPARDRPGERRSTHRGVAAVAALTLTDRLDALGRAVEAGRDVLAPDLKSDAEQVLSRAGDRLRLPERTVVALAGPTGSGKSSLLNAMAGHDVAEVAVTRPTTSEALAIVRGDGAGPLLDWLGVRRRHHLGGEGDGLVVLDLPDHDSVATDHRLEAERLVALVDLMVWVVDPQKYADAAVHEQYLRGLAGHRDVLLIALNQVDRLTPAELQACHRDLERLLAQDDLAGVPVLDVSARTGGPHRASTRPATPETSAVRRALAATRRWAASTSAARSRATPSPVRADTSSTGTPARSSWASNRSRSRWHACSSAGVSRSTWLSAMSSTSRWPAKPRRYCSCTAASAYFCGSTTQTIRSTSATSRSASSRWSVATESWSGRSRTTRPSPSPPRW